MNVYIAEGGQKDARFVAYLIGDKLYRQDIEGEHKADDVLVSALRFVKEKIQRHPSCYDGKAMSVYQSIAKSYSEEAFDAFWELRNLWGGNAEMLNCNPVADRLCARVLGTDDGYRFKEGDLIIAERERGEDETEEMAERNRREFSLCARVVTANPEEDKLILDKYLACGKVSCKEITLPLLEMELQAYYRPMMPQEIIEFREGMTELLCNPLKRPDNPMITHETYEVVTRAADAAEQALAKRQARKPEIGR